MVRRTRAVPARTPQPVKIVVTGPFSAGKTTLIQTISEVAIVGTDRDVTDDTRSVKERTTVAMDFGRISFESDASLFLFGTPGQRRFEVMWEILSEGMIGFILLIHAGDPRSVAEAHEILQSFQRYADVPFVVGVTHLDEVGEPVETVLADVRATLGLPHQTPVVPCDPRERTHVKELMLRILYEVEERLERAERAVTTESAESVS
jgi:signal recognition particle receptor subunit beta